MGKNVTCKTQWKGKKREGGEKGKKLGREAEGDH